MTDLVENKINSEPEFECQRQRKVSITKTQRNTRPLWIIFQGLVNEPGIGSLMQLEPIRRSLLRSATYLKEIVNFDLLPVLQNESEIAFREVKPCVLSVVAIQIAMSDVLQELGISGDTAAGFMGTSVGEFTAGYWDGCMTREETLLVAYWFGEAFPLTNSKCEPGGMLVLDIPWEETRLRCPAGVYLASNTSKRNVMIGGPSKLLQTFQKELEDEGRKVINASFSEFAFHTKYVSPTLPFLKPHLEQILGDCVRVRSSKWLTTSNGGNNFSVDYILNNIVSPVYLREAYEQIPDNAVFLEVGPKALFMWVLREILPPSITRICLGRMPGEDAMAAFHKGVTDLSASGLEILEGSLRAVLEPTRN